MSRQFSFKGEVAKTGHLPDKYEMRYTVDGFATPQEAAQFAKEISDFVAAKVRLGGGTHTRIPVVNEIPILGRPRLSS